jgi:hypothetical protein
MYRVVEKSFDTRGNMLNTECQVTVALYFVLRALLSLCTGKPHTVKDYTQQYASIFVCLLINRHSSSAAYCFSNRVLQQNTIWGSVRKDGINTELF